MDIQGTPRRRQMHVVPWSLSFHAVYCRENIARVSIYTLKEPSPIIYSIMVHLEAQNTWNITPKCQ